jgi:HEAT repeat protein
MYLQDARYDGDGEVRHAARAALARLGERQALQWFRQGLASENRRIVMESIQAIADEGITLLWPELDRLVDEEEPELASCAREALEQMQEELEREPK